MVGQLILEYQRERERERESERNGIGPQWRRRSRENLVAQPPAQLSHLPLILSFDCIYYILLFKMMYHSLYLTRFQPSYLRSWHRVEDSEDINIPPKFRNNESTYIQHYF